MVSDKKENKPFGRTLLQEKFHVMSQHFLELFQNGTSTDDVALYPDYDYSNYYNADSAGHEFLYITGRSNWI